MTLVKCKKRTALDMSRVVRTWFCPAAECCFVPINGCNWPKLGCRLCDCMVDVFARAASWRLHSQQTVYSPLVYWSLLVSTPCRYIRSISWFEEFHVIQIIHLRAMSACICWAMTCSWSRSCKAACNWAAGLHFSNVRRYIQQLTCLLLCRALPLQYLQNAFIINEFTSRKTRYHEKHAATWRGTVCMSQNLPEMPFTMRICVMHAYKTVHMSRIQTTEICQALSQIWMNTFLQLFWCEKVSLTNVGRHSFMQHCSLDALMCA